MSEGARIPLEAARQAASQLAQRWALSEINGAIVVGSIRRQRPDVGDIEFVAPVPNGRDWLYEQLAKDTGGDGSLFGQGNGQQFAEHVKGLKPGFLHASLRVNVSVDGRQSTIPFEIYRYTKDNQGWITLMRTGPGDFGRIFLGKWKRRWSIPQDGRASVEGHLVNAAGAVIPVPTETRAFELCGMPPILPWQRDAWVEDEMRRSGWTLKETNR